MTQLIKELELYQTELKLQNENLRNTQLELAELRNRYQQLFEFAPIGYFIFNQHDLITAVNNEGAKLLGFSAEVLHNKNFARYIAPDFHHIYSYHRQNVLNLNSTQRCELKLLRRNGVIFYAELKSKLLQSQNGAIEILSFISDISDHKQDELLTHNYQSKVAQAERNNVMHELLGSVIQELNHPIGVITNYIQGSIRRLENENFEVKPILKALNQAAQQTYRVSDIILRIKNFNYRGALKFDLTSIHTLLDEAIILIKYEAVEFSVEIQKRCRVTNMQLSIDKLHIQQVILNLARNAIEAMRDAQTEEPKLILEVSKISNTFIEIAVIDNGPGFDKNNIHKLMDPSYTTKSYGVGLGLAVSRRIVEMHDGTLSMELNPISGACFKFSLPIKAV